MRVLEKRVPTESKGLKIPRTPRPPSPVRRKGAIPGNPQKSLKPSLAKDSSRLRGTVGQEQRRRGGAIGNATLWNDSRGNSFDGKAAGVSEFSRQPPHRFLQDRIMTPRHVSPLMPIIASPFVSHSMNSFLVERERRRSKETRPQRANREVRQQRDVLFAHDNCTDASFAWFTPTPREGGTASRSNLV